MACILIVDDEDLVRGVVRQILEHAGHQIFEATNGYEALDVLGKLNLTW